MSEADRRIADERKNPFSVARNSDHECEGCGFGVVWSVAYPDGTLISQTFGDLEDAEDVCAWMNEGYWVGHDAAQSDLQGKLCRLGGGSRMARSRGAKVRPLRWNDFEQKTAINKRVQKRYDELLAAGKHGLYETLFRIVHEERALAKLELEAEMKKS